MNNDLISREALKKAIQKFEEEPDYQHEGETWQNGLYMAETLIDNAQTVKFDVNDIEYKAYCKGLEDGRKIARPHGEWSDESKDSLLCSACGKRVYKPFIGGFPTERTSRYYPNFCAFCGADMRK